MLLNVNQPQERIVEKEVEVWKDVVGFEDKYLVSNLGRVYSKITKKILKQNLHVNGYFTLATKIGGRNGKAVWLLK